MDSTYSSNHLAPTTTDDRTILNLIEKSRKGTPDSPSFALRPAREAARLAAADGAPDLIVQSHVVLAKAYEQHDEPDKAEETLLKIREAMQGVYRCRIDYALARLILKRQEYERALNALRDTLAALENTVGTDPENGSERNLLIAVHNDLSSVYGIMGEFVDGVQHAYASLALCSGKDVSDVSILNTTCSCANIFYLFEDQENAQRYYQQGMALSEKFGIHSRKPELLYGLARCAMGQSEFSEALGYQRQAWNLVKDGSDYLLQGRIMNWGGIIYSSMENVKMARALAEQSIVLLEKASNPYWYGEAVVLLANLDRMEGNMESAIERFLTLLAYTEKHNFIKKQTMLHQWLSMAYKAIGKTEEALEHLQKSYELREHARSIPEVRAITKLEFSARVAELESRLLASRQEIEQLRKLREERDDNLQKTARTLVEADAITGEGLDASSTIPVDDEAGRLRNWEDFEEQFNRVHDRFKETLVRQFPQLTPSELKVCYLLRGGLISKEIAEVLSISPASVDVYRHRIRKKLELVQEVNLVSYLNSI